MTDASGPLFALAGGGTGGHLYPMLSVARAIQRRAPGSRFMFFATQRPIDERTIRSVMGADGADGRVEIVRQSIRPSPRSVAGWPRFLGAVHVSTRACVRLFRKARPRAVLGSGGYGSVPAVRAARRLGITAALLNPDVLPGRANRYLASMADVVFAQWSQTRRRMGGRVDVRVVGCPIRDSFGGADRSAGIKRFGLDPARRTLLVTGASQGARTINRAMERLAAGNALPAGWQVLHLAGETDAGVVREAYRRSGVAGTVVAYTEQMADALAAADLVLSRAGASTLAEITAVGVASVLMPYPFSADRHQYANARVLSESGAAVVVEDRIAAEANAAALRDRFTALMSDEGVLSRMAHQALALGRTDAAAVVAEQLLGAPREPAREPAVVPALTPAVTDRVP